MRWVSSLKHLDRHAHTKLSRLERRARLLRFQRDDKGNILDIHQIETEVGSLIINTQSYWSNWCRAFYLSGALGGVTISGTVISNGLGITSEHDALTVAITRSLTPSKPPPPSWSAYQEPRWFAPDVLSRILNDAQLSIAILASTFLNSGSQALSHLRIFRNYYAHRSEPLKQEALSLGPTYLVGRPRKPSEILLFVEPRHTVSVLERLVLDMGRLAGALCA
jgi:hypothetical protein